LDRGLEFATYRPGTPANRPARPDDLDVPSTSSIWSTR
jgi:hypothetical protein